VNPSPRTLLFTDVVDSTQLSHPLGDTDMASLWSAHDRTARDLLRARSRPRNRELSVALRWGQRAHNDPANRWLRGLAIELFREPATARR
jgi:hypothetical protein